MTDRSSMTSGVDAIPSCTVTERWIGRTAVLSVSGALDMLTSPRLEGGIDAVLEKKPSTLIVDLTDVDFLASAGMSVLASARDRMTGGFGIVAEGPATSRPLILVGLADALGLHPTLDQALAALAG